MNVKQLTGSDNNQSSPSLYLLIKRLTLLGVFVLACIFAVKFWQYSTKQAQIWHDQQASQLGSSLSAQAAATIALFNSAKNSKQTSKYLQQIATDDYVSSVSLFDKSGKLLASTNEQSLVAKYQSLPNTPLVFVSNIVLDEKSIGYVRLLLNEQKVMQFHSDYQKQMYARLGVLIFICLVAGFILARAFYKMREHFASKAKTES